MVLKILKVISKILIDLLEVVIISSVVVLLTFIFIGQPLVVTGDSMKPNLLDGEQIVADKLSIKFKEINRGDVVIITHPKKSQIFLVKRIIGIPGDKFEIANGKVLINGKILQETYISPEVKTTNGNYIKEGKVLNLTSEEFIVLGDNRENSADSRNWGIIEKNKIIGKAFVVYYPLNSIRLVQ